MLIYLAVIFQIALFLSCFAFAPDCLLFKERSVTSPPLGIASLTHAHRFLLDTKITGSVSLLLDLVARILLLN